AKLCRIMRRETHQIFVDSEELEVTQVHFVYGIELSFELLRRHVQVGIVHVQRTHTHESKQLATLLVAITRSVFRQPQRQAAIDPEQLREQLVMMRTVHRVEVVKLWLLSALLFTLHKLLSFRPELGNLWRQICRLVLEDPPYFTLERLIGFKACRRFRQL